MENATAYTFILTDNHFEYLVIYLVPMCMLYHLIVSIFATDIRKFIKEKITKKKPFKGFNQED